MFIPKSFSVPKKTDMNNMYFLVPITTQDVMEDWLVLTNNAETIFKTRGGRSRKEWPFVCSLEENYKDLAWLELSAEYKQLFSFIIKKNLTLNMWDVFIFIPLIFFIPKRKENLTWIFRFGLPKKNLIKEIMK
ncbi:hypothetical protein COY87_04950 [Candidatus Roizmanbacteria bacterium CG_4_10_14_0_8_um_filter_33_9]|uniref:Uncharacterized protein n=1 Tax=Candidatus Roizmanbacteria bacterium CG_4_10_14_0_8_um_filter_33_9 TaxID=1974826 RepID=A0A2M7QI60_9BACT|nr:MAG: hypothetical protein COY87_04950 [Candidatus Roizmanbacteria bacterium CG_4_10_14_0_8_um_filter_33_9]